MAGICTAVLVQESRRPGPNYHRPTETLHLLPVHKSEERGLCNFKEDDTDRQQFTDKTIKLAQEILISSRNVVFCLKQDATNTHDPLTSNAVKRPLNTAERSERDESSFDHFQAAMLAKRRKAVCKEIEKEPEVNGTNLKILWRRIE
ncbi:hypothetical protein ACROYT_G001550 [Oculina patagonica]